MARPERDLRHRPALRQASWVDPPAPDMAARRHAREGAELAVEMDFGERRDGAELV